MTKTNTILGMIFFFAAGNAYAVNCIDVTKSDIEKAKDKVIFCIDKDGKEAVIDVATALVKIKSSRYDVEVVKYTLVEELSKKQKMEYGLNSKDREAVIDVAKQKKKGLPIKVGGVEGVSTIPFEKLSKKYRAEEERLLTGRGRSQTQVNFDTLQDFCGGLSDRIIDRDTAMKDRQTKIDAVDITALQKAEKDAHNKMLLGCRRDCIKLAITKDGPCALSVDKLAELVSREDLTSTDLGLDIYFAGQSKYIEYVSTTTSVDASRACAKVLAKEGCVSKDKQGNIAGVGDCEAAADWVRTSKALRDGKAKILALTFDGDGVDLPTNDCKISKAADVAKPLWDTCSTRCLELALDSCPAALKTAKAALGASKKSKNSTTGSKSVSESGSPVIRMKSEGGITPAPSDGVPAIKGQ